MEFQIKPYIQVDNINYQTLITEIMSLSIDSLNEIIENIENVFSGKYDASSFSGNLAIVDFDRTTARISYFEELIGIEPTIEIYNMLKSYRRILIECEKNNLDC